MVFFSSSIPRVISYSHLSLDKSENLVKEDIYNQEYEKDVKENRKQQ